MKLITVVLNCNKLLLDIRTVGIEICSKPIAGAHLFSSLRPVYAIDKVKSCMGPTVVNIADFFPAYTVELGNSGNTGFNYIRSNLI